MPKPAVPELKKYMERIVSLRLNASREVTGTLRGYDQFMNVVLDGASEAVSATERHDLGRVVSFWHLKWRDAASNVR